MRALLASLLLAIAPAAFGAVSLVGTPANITSASTYTAEAGSNRVVVIQACNSPTATGTTPTVTAATYGTNSIAGGELIQAQVANRTASNRITCYIWYVKEADIESGAQGFSFTWSMAMDAANTYVVAYTLQGVDQTTPVNTSTGGAGLNIGASNPWSGSIAVADGTYQVLAAGVNASVTSAPDASWTEYADSDPSSAAFRIVSHGKATATAATVNWSVTFGANQDGTVGIVSFAPSTASAPTFSGTIANQTPTEGVAISTIDGSSFFDGGEAPTSYSIQGCTLPSGISLNTSTGDITGTVDEPPTVTGCVLRGTNATGSDDSNAFSWTISPPTGKQFVTLASVSATSWCDDFNDTATPDIAAGDIIKIDLVTDPDGFAWTQGTDCDGSYSGTSARQSLEYDIYDTSVTAYMAGGPGNLWFNDPGVVCSNTLDLPLDVDSAMTTLDLDTLCDHPLGDALSYAVTTGTLPTGLSLNGGTGEITGTPTVEDEGGVEVQVTATSTVSGSTATQDIRFYPIDTITVPDCDALDVTACLGLIENNWLEDSVQFTCNNTVPANEVYGQSPAANTEVEPGTTISLEVAQACSGASLRTTFLSAETAVPASATFVAGGAYAQDGSRYVALWPESNVVFYRGPFAHRSDGALIINPTGLRAVNPVGVAMTDRGEVIVTSDAPTHVHNGWPMVDDGRVSMTDIF